jgi:CheY-like chemotaxis protein
MFPLQAAMGISKGPSAVAEVIVPQPLAKPKQVLIVEDDATIREELAELLTQDGYVVVTARDGRDALEQLHWGLRPAVILLDLRMTVMTGWEFRVQQKKDAAVGDIPVIAMTTGRWRQEDLKEFPERISKPIDLAALRDLLDRYCAPGKYLDRRRGSRGD